ncbi:MAG TPA: hypothetical protein VEB63_09350 [Chitinophagaceae bacterium]|nr:hypothetical protein [Chitinophagaceae bacterium]
MKYLVFLVALFAIGCSDGGKKSALSKGLCDCFAPVDFTLSEDSRRLLSEAGASGDPVAHFRSELQKLSPEKQDSVSQQLKMGGPNGAAFRVYSDCIKSLRDNNIDSTASTEKKNQLFEEAVNGLKNDRDCAAAYGFFRVMMAATQR